MMNDKRIIIRVKRVYETPDKSDGRRILVDRLWARGLSKEKAKVDVWLKDCGDDHAARSFASAAESIDPADWSAVRTARGWQVESWDFVNEASAESGGV